MHIDSERLAESLTPVELKHIEQCTECANERAKLIALKISANKMELVKPPAEAWKEITLVRESHVQAQPQIKQIIVGFAASFFFVAIGWLMWTNYALQNQLQEVLMANQILEFELKQRPNAYNSSLLMQVSEVEASLSELPDTKEQLKLLQARQRLLEQIVERQKEEKYEFSI